MGLAINTSIIKQHVTEQKITTQQTQTCGTCTGWARKYHVTEQHDIIAQIIQLEDEQLFVNIKCEFIVDSNFSTYHRQC
ncbi:hypothetical protein J6590_097336 [Homalodisca vitripennis]|nr:hypothetical protein J6590_097336 [Homalodisca vitripennis]